MRANVPTDSDFDATLPVVDERSIEEKIDPEQKKLAKIGNSKEWAVIRDYINLRIDMFQKNLFGEELRDVDFVIIGQRYTAMRQVIAEFESLRDEVDRVTKAVNEASEDGKQAV